MIAVLHVKLPFEVLIQEGEKYKLYDYEDDGYIVRAGIPALTDMPRPEGGPDSIILNGKKSFNAGAITITFKKDSFERKVGEPVDPPYTVMNRAIDSLLTRLKYASRAPQIQPITLPGTAWRLNYFNDDGTELEQQDGYLRGHGALALTFSWIACDPDLWDIVHSLPPDFVAPEWRTILTDAKGALPHVGTAIVLTATALEVFISRILDALQPGSDLPAKTWSWINDRSNRQNNPTIEEQYSDLLEMLCGHSLKSNADLWQSFKNLKTARNTFVHEGTAKIGGVAVTLDQASNFILLADKIISQIRDWIPEEMKWPEFQHRVQIQFVQRIQREAPTEGPESAA